VALRFLVRLVDDVKPAYVWKNNSPYVTDVKERLCFL